MIREATITDMPGLVAVGRRFFDAVDWPNGVVFDPEHLSSVLGNLIVSETGAVFVNDDITAVAGAVVYPHYFSGQLTGNELFWWVDPSERQSGVGARLFDTLETWAEERGAKTFSMITLHGLAHDTVGSLYERRGYQQMEHMYMRAL